MSSGCGGRRRQAHGVANVGPANPREFTEVTSTTDVLSRSPRDGGAAVRVEGRHRRALPRVVAVRSSDVFKGDDWIGVRMREAERGAWHRRAADLRRRDRPLLLVGSLAATWARRRR